VSPISTSIFCPKRPEDLDINPAEDGFIIYQPDLDRVHFLNPTAVLILELCDGTRPIAAIAAMVQEAYGLPAPPLDEVRDAVEKMTQEGLLPEQAENR
jgi:hypothetical protein